MNDNIEVRNLNYEVRAEEDGTIKGTALTFNQPYDLGSFVEQISPQALEGVIERSDIYAYFNHNPELGVLARSNRGKGSLKLNVSNRGLDYQFVKGKSPIHLQLTEHLERGEITASSFAFTVAEDQVQKMNDGRFLRTILKFDQLFDVSPVWNPANPNTTVAIRKIDEFKAAEDLKELESKVVDVVEERSEVQTQVEVRTEEVQPEQPNVEEPIVDKKAEELKDYYSKYDQLLSKYSAN